MDQDVSIWQLFCNLSGMSSIQVNHLTENICDISSLLDLILFYFF